MFYKTELLRKIRALQEQITRYSELRDEQLTEYFRLQREEPLNLELINLRYVLYHHNLNAIKYFSKKKEEAQKKLENLAC